MRSSIKVASVILFFGAFAISVFTKNSVKTGIVSDRAPSSIPVKAVDPSIVIPENAEVTAYHYERNVLAEIKDKTTKPILNLSMQGTVFITALSHTEDSDIVSVQFEITQGSDKQEHDSHIPFVVELSKGQNILSVRTPKKLSQLDEDDVNVLKDFMSLYAYGVNRDTTGVYQFKLDRDGPDVQKTKIKYESPALQTIAILSSNTQGEVEAGKGTWLKVQGKEQTRMDGMGNGQSLLTTSLFKIEKLTSPLKPKIGVRSFADLENAGLDLISHREFATSSWTELKARLANIKSLTRPQRLALFHDLSKLLKSDPEAVLAFRKYIEAMAKEPGLMTFGIGVLATAGTDLAQATLREWYEGGYGVEHTVLNAFSTANAELTDDTRSFLKGIVSDHTQPELAQNAAYALGSSLKHSNDDGARAALNSFYTGSQNEADKLTALDAMGNSGDDHFVPTLKIAAQSANPAEREKAVFGARFLAPDAAAPLLLAGYQDGTLAVQNASIRALAFQENLAPHAPLIRACATAGNASCQSMLKRLNP
jgi:hypothetical protein